MILRLGASKMSGNIARRMILILRTDYLGVYAGIITSIEPMF
jgi:hypothetical protein